MKKIISYLFLFLLIGTPNLFAQNTNPLTADPSSVQSNGDQPWQNNTAANVNTYTGDAFVTSTDFNYHRNNFNLKYERYFHNGITSPMDELGTNWMSNYDISLVFTFNSAVMGPKGQATTIALVMPHEVWQFTRTNVQFGFTKPAGCFYNLSGPTTINNTQSTFNKGVFYTVSDKYGTVYYFALMPNDNIGRLYQIQDVRGNVITLSWQLIAPYISTDYLFEMEFAEPNNKDIVCPNPDDVNHQNSSWQVPGYGCAQAVSAVSESSQVFYTLSSVNCTQSNWSINFNYYNNGATTVWGPLQYEGYNDNGYYNCTLGLFCQPKPESVGTNGGAPVYAFSDLFEAANVQVENTSLLRLQSVVSYAGGVPLDTITFDEGGTASDIFYDEPITQVTRSPSGLNATYQYYAYNATTPGNPQMYTLNSFVDPSAPSGLRSLTYWSQNNVNNGTTNPVTQVVDPLGQVVHTYNYSTDGSGNKVTSVNGPNGLIEADVYNFQTASQTALLIQKRFLLDGHPYSQLYTKFNSNNQVTSLIDGNSNSVSMIYDGLGNMTYEKSSGDTNPVTYFYNGASRLVSSTDKNLVNRSYVYYGGSQNQYIETITEGSRVTSYTYMSPNGQLTQKTVKNGNGKVTTYGYDNNGNPLSITGPLNGPPENLQSTTSFDYDSRGRLQYKIDSLGQKTSYSYFNDYWLNTVSYSDGTVRLQPSLENPWFRNCNGSGSSLDLV